MGPGSISEYNSTSYVAFNKNEGTTASKSTKEKISSFFKRLNPFSKKEETTLRTPLAGRVTSYGTK